VVTGAASGIGHELARQLLDCGARVTALDLNAAGLAGLQQSCAAPAGQLDTRCVDVTDREALAAAIDAAAAHGGLDFIFNNAGIAVFEEVQAMTPQQWQRIVDVNIRGVIHGTDIAYRLMCAQGHGHIVNTASAAGLIPVPLMTAYTMSKHAVVGLSMALREEGARHNVRVSAICPGGVDTNIYHAADSRAFDTAAMYRNAKPMSLSTRQAVHIILRGVARNRAKIIFPRSMQLAVLLHALAPRLYSRLMVPTLMKLPPRT